MCGNKTEKCFRECLWRSLMKKKQFRILAGMSGAWVIVIRVIFYIVHYFSQQNQQLKLEFWFQKGLQVFLKRSNSWKMELEFLFFFTSLSNNLFFSHTIYRSCLLLFGYLPNFTCLKLQLEGKCSWFSTCYLKRVTE